MTRIYSFLFLFFLLSAPKAYSFIKVSPKAYSYSLADVDYSKADSTKVVKLLREASRLKSSTNWMTYFGKQFCGVPYVAKTLERNKTERLIVNLRQLDCTTFVETTLALTLCAKNGKTSFADYCHYLRLVRYRQGRVSYPSRLHYFTQWIDDNSSLGFVKEVTSASKPFTALQTLNIDFMTTHVDLYPMLKGNKSAIAEVRAGEKALNGRKFRYIPKRSIDNSSLLRRTIHDGDILVMLTSKKGLDTSHIGIAVWHKDGLHLLNASQLRHKVVVESKLFRDYMLSQKSQTGIRVVRVM